MPFREISASFYWRLVESGRCSSSSDALKKSFENGSKKCTECRFSFKFDNKYTSSKWLSRRQGTKKYREHLTLTHPMSCAQQLFWFSAIFFWLSFIKMILYFFVSFWITKLSPIAFLTKAMDANGSEALTIIIWRSDKSDDDDETWRKKNKYFVYFCSLNNTLSYFEVCNVSEIFRTEENVICALVRDVVEIVAAFIS